MNMKAIYRYIVLAFCLAAAAACVKDNRLNFVEPDHISFSGLDKVSQTTVCSAHYKVSVIKSGRNLSTAHVTLKIDNDALQAYNEANGTSFKALPSDKYKVETLTLDFAQSDSRLTSDLTWNPEELLATVTDDNWVIPVSLSCSEPGMVTSDRTFVIVNVRPSSIGFSAKTMEYTESKERSEVSSPVKISASLTKSNPRDELVVECEIDESLVTRFQDETSYYYNMPPEGCVSLKNPKATIAPGDKLAEFNLSVNETLLSEIHGGHVVPIKIKSLSLEGLSITEDVCYFIIKPNF